MAQIKSALYSVGRNVFIYGDRGVGKTSLAQTAAYIHQSSDGTPILLACDSSTTVMTLSREIAVELIQQSPLFQSSSLSLGGSVKFFEKLGAEIQKQITEGKVPEPRSLNEAISLLEFAAAQHSEEPVAVIDEFDRMTAPDQQALFGDLIKQFGDRAVGLKLIFSGVGDSLDVLLNKHESCYRYLASIKLDRLAWDARMDIVRKAAAQFGVSVDKTYLYRIAAISDGFPHFIHLIASKLFWAMFNDPEQVDAVSAKHFKEGIQEAVKDVQHHLDSAYASATKKYRGDYEEVLWAVADHPDLERRSAAIYEQSYARIMSYLKKEPLERATFNNRMNNLKKASHGAILRGTRQGWYEFNEPMMRGYVRLKAEQAGVQLDIDHGLERSIIDTYHG